MIGLCNVNVNWLKVHTLSSIFTDSWPLGLSRSKESLAPIRLKKTLCGPMGIQGWVYYQNVPYFLVFYFLQKLTDTFRSKKTKKVKKARINFLVNLLFFNMTVTLAGKGIESNWQLLAKQFYPAEGRPP